MKDNGLLETLELLKIWKVRYFLSFIYYRARIALDCSHGAVRLYLSEGIRLTNYLLNTSWKMPGGNNATSVTTLFGTFYFIGNLFEYSIVCPAFEREDVEALIAKITHATNRKKRVLFIDIGANVGVYTIAVSASVNSPRLRVESFEPDPVYFSHLQKNIRINHAQNVRVHNLALLDKKKDAYVTRAPVIDNSKYSERMRFRFRTLDSILPKKFYSRFDEVYVKIDIDGEEARVLAGANNLFRTKSKVTFLVEDFAEPKILAALAAHGCVFSEKQTPYNSFWEKKRARA